MVLSGQQLLLGCGNANIHNKDIPVATARKPVFYLPTSFFIRFIYSLNLYVIQTSYYPKCNLDEISQGWCFGDCIGHPHIGWRGCMAVRHSRQKVKHCPVSHLGSLTRTISRCPPVLTDHHHTVDFECVRACRSERSRTHNRCLCLGKSNHSSLLLQLAETAFSVERCKAAKLGAHSEPSCKECLFSSLNLRKLISQGFLAPIYIPSIT